MLICLGVLQLLQKSCSKEAEWVGTGWLGLNEEKNSKVRKGRGRGGVSYLPTWLSLHRRRTGTLGLVPVYLEESSLALRDLLTRICCRHQMCRDFCCLNLT